MSAAANPLCLRAAEEESGQKTDTAAAIPLVVNLTAYMLSGREASVAMPRQASAALLRRALGEAFGLEKGQRADFRMFFGSLDLSEGAGADAQTLEEAGLVDGSRVEVGVRSWVRPMKMPSKFKLSLRARNRCLSSAFISLYEVSVEVPGNTVHAKTWRKNDHDRFTIDTLAGTCEGARGHWMCGDSAFQRTLDTRFPLGDLLAQRIEECEPVFDQEDLFWRSPDDMEVDTEPLPRRGYLSVYDEDDTSDCRPRSQFTAPAANCTELIVNTTLPFLTLCRVLLDTHGRPIRAALLVGCPNHDEVEEYDVLLRVVDA
jgi:hypothetical protein